MASALVIAMIACVLVPTKVGQVPSVFFGPIVGFHPRIVPSSVANRKLAGALDGLPAALQPEIVNAPDAICVLNTRPVGAPPLPNGSSGVGIRTTSGTLLSVPLASVRYSVETPAPLFETQNGEVDDSPTPHGFNRSGS